MTIMRFLFGYILYNLDADNLTYTFRFPKEHTLYQYYDEHGTGVNAFESIKREQPGRFIYESKDSTFSFPDTMRFYANSDLCKFGNGGWQEAILGWESVYVASECIEII